MVGYYGLPRTPASLLTALTCDSIRPGKQNLNPSFFCDRKVDAEITRAQKIQITNPDAAVGRWARIENELVDLAPWVPLFTPWSGDLVSQRVGNYQYNPVWGSSSTSSGSVEGRPPLRRAPRRSEHKHSSAKTLRNRAIAQLFGRGRGPALRRFLCFA